MANNYYGGFTHGGTQYGNQYTTTQAAPGTYPPQQQQQYGLQSSQTAYAPPVYPEIQGYVKAVGGSAVQQNYYQQQGPPGVQQQPTYSGTLTPVHPKPPGISSQVTQPITPRPSANSTVYPTYSANTAGTTNTSSYAAGFSHPVGTTKVSNYDRAVLTAVTAYAAQAGSGTKGAGMGYGKRGGGGGFSKMKGSRPSPKPQTLHYCDVCKISCAGPQTYKEHLEGQKHKKKEALMKPGGGTSISKGSGPIGIRCELCDVTCTGNDAYAAHIRGAKHQKVVKLHTKLGKPIPEVPASTIQITSGPKQPQGHQQQQQKNHNNQIQGFVKPAPPKISFLGPKTDFDRYGGGGKNVQQTQQTSATSAPPAPPLSGGNVAPIAGKNTIVESPPEKDIQPVGQDYIEELRSDDGKIISFNCKLCDCKFNDPNAKEMHMKGRRHRLQYKKKVNPDLVVDVKPSNRQKKIDERRSGGKQSAGLRRPLNQGEMFGPGPRGPLPLLPPRGFGPGGPGPGGPPHMLPNHFYNSSMPPRRQESMDDKHVMFKHQEIYPLQEELQAIQKIVSNTEKGLKLVSDVFAEEWANKMKESGSDSQIEAVDVQQNRILKGVMRVGHLAKGLLLRGDRLVQLIVLCSQKPSITMLNRVFDLLPAQFKTLVTDDTYEIEKKEEESSIYVKSSVEPRIQIKLILTSPLLRGPNPEGEVEATQAMDPPDPLNKKECLDALASLRHTKFFQARATSLQSCVIAIRILRDICNRIPAWNGFPSWGLELLAEKAINSAGVPLSPGEALRVILETISYGILLPGGPGILDPCEKESMDAIGAISAQQREDITSYAQFALRKITFRKIHEVLNIEPLMKGPLTSRKRRRNSSAGGKDEEKEGKKDKKEEESSAAMDIATSTVKVEV